MKKKSIIISIIVILILIIAGLFIYNLPKEEPIEPMPTVEPIEAEEETTVEIETTTEEVNALKSDPSIPTFNAKQGTVEGYEVTEEVTTEEVITGEENYLNAADHDAPPEGTQFEGTEVSPLAGTTSKHGYVYPDDYVECGPKPEDRRGDTEMMFDMGWMTEEQYQASIKHHDEVAAGTATTIEDIAEYNGDVISEANPASPSEGSTTPGGGGDPIELPVLPETVPDGRICY